MNKAQKYTPKYWVVHDTSTDEIFIETMSKTRDISLQLAEKVWDNGCSSLVCALWMEAHPEEFGYQKDIVADWFLHHPTLRCELIEINLVGE